MKMKIFGELLLKEKAAHGNGQLNQDICISRSNLIITNITKKIKGSD